MADTPLKPITRKKEFFQTAPPKLQSSNSPPKFSFKQYLMREHAQDVREQAQESEIIDGSRSSRVVDCSSSSIDPLSLNTSSYELTESNATI